MTKQLNRRNLIGSVFSLILVGEVTVGFTNGLFTPIGLVVLLCLYFFYFLVLESLVAKYRLSNLGLTLINFALYSVLITGFLHGELADYVSRPDNMLITTLIRIQSSLFPLFVFLLINRIAPRTTPTMSVRLAVGWFTAFIFLVSPSRNFGLIALVTTVKDAPVVSLIFSVLAFTAFVTALRIRAGGISYKSRVFDLCSVALLMIGLVPGLTSFIILMTIMIFVGIKFLLIPKFRQAGVF